MYTIWKTTFSCRPGSMAPTADTSTWTARTVSLCCSNHQTVDRWTDEPKNTGNTWQNCLSSTKPWQGLNYLDASSWIRYSINRIRIPMCTCFMLSPTYSRMGTHLWRWSNTCVGHAHSMAFTWGVHQFLMSFLSKDGNRNYLLLKVVGGAITILKNIS